VKDLKRVKPKILAFDSLKLWKAKSRVAEATAEVAGVA
jgi:hypothetical protein